MSVYKLTCSETNKIYYGSTKMTLKERKGKGWYHCACKDFINPKMDCMETVDNLDELEIRENHYILNYECVNKNVAYSTQLTRKIRSDRWRLANKEKLNDTVIKYRAKVIEEKRHECKLCHMCFQSIKKLERHTNGYRHQLKNESFLKYGNDWEKHYLEDNIKRYNKNRRIKPKKV